MNKKCIYDCANCVKDNGEDVCKIALDDGIVNKIGSDDEVPDTCYKKGYFKEKKHTTGGNLFA